MSLYSVILLICMSIGAFIAWVVYDHKAEKARQKVRYDRLLEQFPIGSIVVIAGGRQQLRVLGVNGFAEILCLYLDGSGEIRAIYPDKLDKVIEGQK